MAEGFIEGKRVKLVHEKVDPLPDGSATVTVELWEKIGKTEWRELPNKTILFFLDGSADPTDEKDTNEQGRASTEVQLTPGKHRVTARVAGADWYETIPIALPEPKGKKAADLRVFFSGPRGYQRLVISVAGDDGLKIPGYVVTIDDGVAVKTHNTEDPYPMSFSEPRRLVRITAGNAKCLWWEGVLMGPKRSSNTHFINGFA